MRDRKLNKSELDAIGKKLLASAALRDSEIDRIAGGSGLFEGVMKRVSKGAEPQTGSWTSLAARYRFAFGSAFAAVLCVAVLGIVLQQRPAPIVSNVVQLPDAPPGIKARPDITPQVIVDGVTKGRAEFPEEPAASEPVSPPEPAAQRTVYRRPERSRPIVQRASHKALPNENFVAVTYTGDGGESARGGRVVRVDVPRSALFAMGFNVSLENDSPTVKADLLVGPDGVTRAVRLVE